MNKTGKHLDINHSLLPFLVCICGVCALLGLPGGQSAFAALPEKLPVVDNLAPLAELSGSGEDLRAAVDGVKQQDGVGEWLGGSPNAWYGLITYPSLELKWNRPQMVNKVVLYDRSTLTEHMAASVLKFSDGSEEHVFAVPNGIGGQFT
jgi:hypothetical protein